MTDFIERARALDKAATEGPWSHGEDIKTSGEPVFRGGSDKTGEDVFSCPRYEHARSGTADAEFIAAARTMLPAAVEALARVRELHTPKPGESYGETNSLCPECWSEWWPCATYQATEVGG